MPLGYVPYPSPAPGTAAFRTLHMPPLHGMLGRAWRRAFCMAAGLCVSKFCMATGLCVSIFCMAAWALRVYILHGALKFDAALRASTCGFRVLAWWLGFAAHDGLQGACTCAR
jgi:hypothetical protein